VLTEVERTSQGSRVARCCSLTTVVLVIVVLMTCASVSDRQSMNVSLRVHFTLTDLDYHPIRDVPVRVVFGSDPDWQRKGNGYRFVTDMA